MPPPLQPARKGVSVQIATVMPVHAVIGMTIKYHIEFQEQVASKSVLIDLLFVSSLLQLSLTRKGRGRKIFAHASRANFKIPPQSLPSSYAYEM